RATKLGATDVPVDKGMAALRKYYQPLRAHASQGVKTLGQTADLCGSGNDFWPGRRKGLAGAVAFHVPFIPGLLSDSQESGCWTISIIRFSSAPISDRMPLWLRHHQSGSKSP